MEESYLTPEQLAERWNIKITTLSQWRWNGQGPAYSKIGKCILYWPHDIKAYERSKRRRSTSDLIDQSIKATKEQADKSTHNFIFVSKKKGGK